MLKTQLALSLLCALLAGSLYADRITYLTGSGPTLKLEVADRATVTAWSAAKVDFEAANKTRVSVKFSDIISVDRTGGTQSKEFAGALAMIGTNQRAAIDAFTKIADSGGALDKEEAQYLRAQLLEAQGGNRATPIAAYQLYIQRYKAGYFAREAYQRLARMQSENDGRTTLRNMAAADPSLRRLGNQLLGEHEARFSKYPAAMTAFQTAISAARDERDNNNMVLAQAWEAWCKVLNGDVKAGTDALVAITSDDKFDDPFSSDDEIALAIAFRALGDALYQSSSLERAYDAYVKGAYYAWWISGNSEGHCLARAYVCAKKLDGTDPKWRKRRDKLRTALAVGFPPRVLADADKE